MTYLVQRLILNSYGWVKPSPGRLGPSGEGEYVQKNGFGHEDWNFNHDLAIDGHIYGYFYYRPAPRLQNDVFNVAFVIRQNRLWLLVGFYLDARYEPTGAPLDSSVLDTKKRHLMELRAHNSLKSQWSSESRIREKLSEESKYIGWRVAIENAIRLPQPLVVPEKVFKSNNYHLTKPSFIDPETFAALRNLAAKAVLPLEDDESAFPEGREIYLKHRARERSARVVELAKSRYIEKNGHLNCEACGFDFEKRSMVRSVVLSSRLITRLLLAS